MVLPAATAVTRPLELIVAIPVADETHALLTAALPDPVNCVVLPSQTASVPVMVGSAFTVTVAVT